LIAIRFHGRGGQGAAISSYILAEAIFRDGYEVQAFPMFGVERRGAPVASFIRMDNKPIYVRCEVYEPDYVVVLDPTLIQAVDVTSGKKPGGFIMVNTDQPVEEIGIKGDFTTIPFDGTKIALEYHLGTKVAPIVNTVMMGAFAKSFGKINIDNLLFAIKDNLPRKIADRNAEATKKAYDLAPKIE